MDNFQCEYKPSVCLGSLRLCDNLSGGLDLKDHVTCPLSWSASSAQSQACNQVAAYEEKGCETSGERKVAHSVLAKWSVPNLGQDYLGSQVLKSTKHSFLSVCAKTFPHLLHQIFAFRPARLEGGFYSPVWNREITCFALSSLVC